MGFPPVFGGRGRSPSLLRRGEKASGKDTATTRPSGPLAGHVEVIGVNGLGLYGPILGLGWPMLAHLGAMLA